MRNKGPLFYKLGSYGFILFALLHALSFFTDPAQAFTNEEDRRVWGLLVSHVFTVEGFSTTVFKLLAGYNFYLSIFTLGLGFLNVIALKALAHNGAALGRMAAINLLTTALLLLVTVIFFHLPPIIIFSAIFALFLAAFLTLV
jgi:hypothetical protein